MEIEGIVSEIIYKNEVNSYVIAEFEMEDGMITVVGYLPFINVGDNLKLYGKYVEHKEYGTQFKVDTFERIMPKTLDSLERYLANGSIKGIGPITAKKIVKTFGEETIYVLKNDPEKLSNISGITKQKAIDISQTFIENWEIWQIVSFLEKFGIGVENAKKVYDLLGTNAIEKIEKDPYILIDLSRNVDFKIIDKMAMNIGISQNNEKRIKSAIKYALTIITYNGHCCALQENLIQYVQTLIGVSNEDIELQIKNLSAIDEIVIEKRNDNENWIYLYSFYKAEKDIAELIIKIQGFKNVKRIKNIKMEIKKQEKILDVELSEKQKEAIELINDNNVTIITGGPGTGKTTIIKTILEIYKNKKDKVVLCAPTGRAAKRITELTGEDASTLHRLLEIGKINEDEFYNKNSDFHGMPVDADIIIVDEVSMVDLFLMSYLLKCVYLGTKIVLVGDSDQLPSVGPGNVLKDLINSERIVTIHLDKIFRQAAKSKIILNAHKVNEGEGFVKNEEEAEDTNQDFFFIEEDTQEKMLEDVISLSNGRLKKYGDYDFFKNIQILTPTKKGILGTKELNKSIQEVINPKRSGIEEKNSMGVVYRENDRIMQVKNNYDMYWERKKANGEYEIGNGVFNGEIGRIDKIDIQEKTVEVKFDDDRKCIYDFSDLDQIEHSYSMTIHKAQR